MHDIQTFVSGRQWAAPPLPSQGKPTEWIKPKVKSKTFLQVELKVKFTKKKEVKSTTYL